jgi:hypothetical protein
MISLAQLNELKKKAPISPAARNEFNRLSKLYKQQRKESRERKERIQADRRAGRTPREIPGTPFKGEPDRFRYFPETLQSRCILMDGFKRYARRFGITDGLSRKREVNLITALPAQIGMSNYVQASKLSANELREILEYLESLGLGEGVTTHPVRIQQSIHRELKSVRLQGEATENTPAGAQHSRGRSPPLDTSEERAGSSTTQAAQEDSSPQDAPHEPAQEEENPSADDAPPQEEEPAVGDNADRNPREEEPELTEDQTPHQEDEALETGEDAHDDEDDFSTPYPNATEEEIADYDDWYDTFFPDENFDYMDTNDLIEENSPLDRDRLSEIKERWRERYDRDEREVVIAKISDSDLAPEQDPHRGEFTGNFGDEATNKTQLEYYTKTARNIAAGTDGYFMSPRRKRVVYVKRMKFRANKIANVLGVEINW